MGELTNADIRFFDRVAMKIAENPTLTIEEAARKVLDDDARTVNKVLSLRDDERKELAHGMAKIIYDRIRSKEAL